MRKIPILLLACLLLSGCATKGTLQEQSKEIFKGFLGISTQELTEYRSQAVTKTFDCVYDECYARVENALKEMTDAEVYSKDKDLIAIYYVDLNTTPVGIFFKTVDAGHTQIEISSASIGARDAVAKKLFLLMEPPKDEKKSAGAAGAIN
jgi:hypothetical protein